MGSAYWQKHAHRDSSSAARTPPMPAAEPSPLRDQRPSQRGEAEAHGTDPSHLQESATGIFTFTFGDTHLSNFKFLWYRGGKKKKIRFRANTLFHVVHLLLFLFAKPVTNSTSPAAQANPSESPLLLSLTPAIQFLSRSCPLYLQNIFWTQPLTTTISLLSDSSSVRIGLLAQAPVGSTQQEVVLARGPVRSRHLE